MKKILLLLGLLFAAPAFAADAPDPDAVARVEKYLTSIYSIVADFNQVDANGAVATGKFYLKRPGKMRWQYNPPTPVLLVSNGTTITYYDAELDQVNYVPIDRSLAGFLAQPIIKLDSETTQLTAFTAKDDVIRATVVRKGHADEGALTLEFSDNPLAIRQMIVRDQTGQETTVSLQNAKFGADLPDKLFVFEDPRGVTPRKRQ
ncbi:MAG: outer membrane lipoprotein carrier protein LolA [Alphaproteobacteria bacterium]